MWRIIGVAVGGFALGVVAAHIFKPTVKPGRWIGEDHRRYMDANGVEWAVADYDGVSPASATPVESDVSKSHRYSYSHNIWAPGLVPALAEAIDEYAYAHR
jgi:hypothetical protein